MILKSTNDKKRNLKSASILALAYISSTRNNTIITITDLNGNTLAWASPGCVGFKGARRSTSYAAQAAAENVGHKVRQMGISSVQVYLKGLGEGRESSIRGLKTANLNITSISDITPIPHNGCRLPKRRRI